MITIALPKGRLGDKVYKLFASIGYDCSEIFDDNRKLIFENKENGVRYLLVKPSDVAVYVYHGAADIGIAGKDILDECGLSLYELLDLKLGKCHMSVAAPNDYKEDQSRPIRVATKFPNIAKRHYMSFNREIEIIKLNGSIEIAPLVGLSDVIVDIVETGTTLKENNLKVLEKFLPISARLIANRSSYTFKQNEIDLLCGRLQKVLEEK
ncbi:MAG: ATP phosphoribosyltransferase [Clostridia bacterium]|nr:ATP phosphoribosyltransferase [Clostridia bacterium]MBQ4119865.1 ATP phosphoribosyltransferase [Clostridia bacterium]MBQ7108115.1 ATP phosphoribosyltransferase [Clostridia bacterium]